MRSASLAACLALVAVAVLAQVAVPALQQRVTDLTGTLTPAQRASLEQRLAAFEQQKGSQVAVLMVPTTAPETIEQYGIRVADAWKLGRKNVDDGAILLVAKEDRALRIEVGYGLEGALPDAIAKRIVDEVILPRFRAGDFAGGIDAGVQYMLKVISGESLPTPAPAQHPVTGSRVENMFGIGVFALVLSQVFGRVIGKFPAAAGFGGLFGFIAYLALGAAAIGVFAGVVLFVVSLAAQLGGGRRGVWSSGGLGGGFRGGGGFGGGGFRGGGGGFGGGGASGRW